MEEKKNKTNKKLTIIILALILAMLCTFGYLVCRKIKDNDAKQKFFSAIDKLVTEVSNKEKTEEIKTLSGDYSLTMNVSSRFIDQEIQDIINKLELNWHVDLDNEKSNYNVDLNTTYDKENLLKAKVSAQNNNLYVFFDEIYSKWIKVDSTTKINTDNLLTVEDYKILANEFKKALNYALKNNYFSKDVENDLNKYTLTIDKDNISVITNNILDYLESSKEFIKVYEKVSNTKFSDASKKIKSEMKQFTTMDPILISVYTDNSDTLKQVSFETSISDEKVKVVMEITDIHNIKLTIYDNDMPIISGSIEGINDKDQSIINVKLAMTGIFTVKVKMVYSFKYNEKITLPTITDSINNEDMSQEEIQDIYMKLLDNKGLIKIMEAIQNYMNENEEI